MSFQFTCSVIYDVHFNFCLQAFSEDISEEIIQKIVTELIELYELDDKR